MAQWLFPEVERAEAERALFEALRGLSPFSAWPDDEIESAAAAVIDADMAFIQASGSDQGEVYDEVAAFKAIRQALKQVLGHRSGRQLGELTEYATEAWEAYLDAVGVIDWE